MIIRTCHLVEEMLHQLERLDEQQATFQAQSHLANRYAQWCDAMFCDLQSQRIQLEQIIHQWEEVDHLYNAHGGRG